MLGTGLPSIIQDANSICGPAITPIQAVSCKPVKAPSNRLMRTWPRANKSEPDRTKLMPIICPFKAGAPSIMATPTSATPMPNNWRMLGFSPRRMAAMIMPKITSLWTRSTAGVASINANPEYVSPYCNVAAIKEIPQRAHKCPRGIGTKHTNKVAASKNLSPINNKGGK